MNHYLEAIVFMKFGYHALEVENDIIVRKQNEFLNSGKIFWGYGGTICHPLNQIQPFAKDMISKGKKTFLVMSFTKSKPSMSDQSSIMFSTNGIDWKNIPDGIKVTGSKYAIVCSNLTRCNIKINLNDYTVALGPSKGKIASDYIAFRVDKGCLIRSQNQSTVNQETNIQLISEIVEPFAVMLK